MHASRLRRFTDLCSQPLQNDDTYFLSHFQIIANTNGSNDSLQEEAPHKPYCTLESSSMSGNDALSNSPSNGSPITKPDPHFTHTNYGTPFIETTRLGQIMPHGDLKQVLIACAKAVSDNDLMTSHWLMSELRKMVSVSGEPIQRLGAYMLEGLVARSSSSGSSFYKSLRSKHLPPTTSSYQLLTYMHTLYEVCPYFKFGHMSANGAIAEAMKSEQSVHIIDFQIGQGSQWVTLIQAFASRPGGPPRIRITGIDDRGSVSIAGKNLSELAESFKVPFEFHSSDIDLKNLGIQPGEALAVNFAYMLHHMPDESVSTLNHRDRLLRMVKNLNPKVVTLVEQESNTNTAAFFPRFVETLDYYAAMFESIDEVLPRNHSERINVEQHCLARDVVNVIACEGTERVERHELLGKWKSRFRMAGFTPYPLSSLVNLTIKRLLENHSDKYRIGERNDALYLGWMDRDLVAACAWK
ncbi:unnamed protein product [Cuscuta europaea]|uniref:Scarecrow-like transcription factor PAT1 n=1 Tax=Cuscuta europaea TaxID=41803 RepID=A0A9P1DYM0_CUSEU|nr:unnamed protein product [Cuscuta europaea]